MNLKFDYTIITDFLSSCVRERVLYELSSPKKRIKALERFSHNVDSIINSKYIYYKGTSINDTIKLEISKSVIDGIVVSFEYQQGVKMSIEEALKYLSYECNTVIIIFGDWLIIKPEYERGEELLYLLKK